MISVWGLRTANPKDGKLDLLTDKNSALVLVDYQPSMFKSVSSGDKTIIKKAAICAAKAATILGVPVVLSSINPKSLGEFIPEITNLFPKQEVFARKIPSFDAFEDERTWSAVKKTGRKKLVISGLWTSMCFAYTALHALKEGYEVYGLIDAAGDSTLDAHKYGVERMLPAAAGPRRRRRRAWCGQTARARARPPRRRASPPVARAATDGRSPSPR